MAENSRKNEFFERESIAIIAITTESVINVFFMVSGEEGESLIDSINDFHLPL